MDILTSIDDLTVRLAQEFNTFKALQGDLTTLTTTDKTSLVNSLNELKTAIDTLQGVNLVRDDLNSSSNFIWSINKIKSHVSTMIAVLWTNVPAQHDSLKKISDDIELLKVTNSNYVSYNAADSKTASEQLQARENIDAPSTTELNDVQTDLDGFKTQVGNTSYNFVTDFENEL